MSACRRGPAPLRAALFLVALSLSGCAGTPREAPLPPEPVPAVPQVDTGQQLVDVATRQLGVPYRRGGADPDGFDCSGLVQFAHLFIGVRVPRTAADQMAASTPVERDALRAGDLVFFRIGAGIDHVGIYAGDGAFVHAPGSGRGVERVRLDQPWFARRYAGAGRFWTGAGAAPGTR